MADDDGSDDQEFHPGDAVSWRTHGTRTTGTVQEEITADTHATGRQVRASDDDPQYRVESDTSGRDAVHKPSALRHED